jgi:hypothetical protein
MQQTKISRAWKERSLLNTRYITKSQKKKKKKKEKKKRKKEKRKKEKRKKEKRKKKKSYLCATWNLFERKRTSLGRAAFRLCQVPCGGPKITMSAAVSAKIPG